MQNSQPKSDVPGEATVPAETRLSAFAELRSNWLLILSCCAGIAIGAAAMPIYSIGVFIVPLQEEFGWSRGEITLGVSISAGMLALASPLVGAIADRYGERFLVPAGLAAVSGAFALLSQIPRQIDYFWTCYALIGGLGAGSSTLVFSRLIALNFRAARGTALAIMLLGLGLTSILAPLLVGNIVAERGWRAGYLAIATACAILAVFVIAGLRAATPKPPQRREPLSVSAEASGWLQDLIRRRDFWLMALAFFTSILAISGMISHIVPLLIDRGAPPQIAAGYAALTGFFMICGRLASGVLIDRFFAPAVGAGFAFVSAAGLLVLSFEGAYAAVIGVFAIGIMMGAELDLAAYLISRYFAPEVFGKAYGILYAVIVAGSMLSISGYGFWADAAGQYGGALHAAAAALAAAGTAFLLLPPFPARTDGRV